MYQDAVGRNFDPNSIPESAAESVLDLNPLAPPPPAPPQQPLVLMPSSDTQHHNNTTTTNSGFGVEENIRLSMEELSYHHQSHHSSTDIELQNELGFTTDHNNNINNSHLVSFEHPTNWDNNIHGVHDQMQQQFPDGTTSAASTPYPQPPDLLNVFSLPRCSPSSLLQNSSITFTNPIPVTSNFPSSLGSLGHLPSAVDTPQGTASSVLYDPLFHLNLPPQPPLFTELLQSLPHGYTLPGSGNGSLFSRGGDEREGSAGGVLYDPDPDGLGRQFDNGVLEFSREMASNGRGRDLKGTKHFATERQRRHQLNGKYDILKTLVPNPTKNDSASILGDAIDYINELLRTVDELKLLVEKKRCGRERIKRHKTEQDGGTAGHDESCNVKPLAEHHDQSYSNGSLRSSWLQRKSKDTEVDIPIIDDEITIKLVQRKKINLLLCVQAS